MKINGFGIFLELKKMKVDSQKTYHSSLHLLICGFLETISRLIQSLTFLIIISYTLMVVSLPAYSAVF